jgi:hypothetical protein
VKTQIVMLDIGPDAGPENLISVSNGLPVAQQGTWNVGITGSVAVTGAFWQATQPVSIAAAVPTKPDGAVWTLTGTAANVNVTNASLAVTGTFWQATQPVTLPVGQQPTAGSVSVTLPSDQPPLSVRLQIGDQQFVLGRQNAEQSLSVVLAADQPIVPVAITDGLDTVGTMARPLQIQLTAAQLAALAPLAVVTVSGPMAVAGSVLTAPLDPTISIDVLPLRALLAEYRAQMYQQIQLAGMAAGQFIPVPEVLPF